MAFLEPFTQKKTYTSDFYRTPTHNHNPYCSAWTYWLTGLFVHYESWKEWFIPKHAISILSFLVTVCSSVGMGWKQSHVLYTLTTVKLDVFFLFKSVFQARPLFCVCCAALQAGDSAGVPCSTTLHYIKQSNGCSFHLICIHRS